MAFKHQLSIPTSHIVDDVNSSDPISEGLLVSSYCNAISASGLGHGQEAPV